MSIAPFTPPSLHAKEFHCPHCLAFAPQGWCCPDRVPAFNHGTINYGQDTKFRINLCGHCKQMCLWISERMVYPIATSAPYPNSDMPSDIQDDFNEARQILSVSPRGAAALLRLAIQKLCKHLGQPGKNINDDIAALVKKGLPEMIQQALDIVRVVGNNAVHPGQLDLEDNPQTASQLFDLVNLVAEIMISQPKRVTHLYSQVIPVSQRDAIVKRDGTAKV